MPPDDRGSSTSRRRVPIRRITLDNQGDERPLEDLVCEFIQTAAEAQRGLHEAVSASVPALAAAMNHAQEHARQLARVLASSGVLRLMGIATAARDGQPDAVAHVIREDPLRALRDNTISEHLGTWRRSKRKRDKQNLQQAVEAFRIGLLEPQVGRPPKIPTGAAKFARTIQGVFEQCPFKLKRKYNNPAARSLSIGEIAQWVATHLPDEHKESGRRAVTDVLTSTPGARKRFGELVAARIFLCSSRRLRALMRKQQV